MAIFDPQPPDGDEDRRRRPAPTQPTAPRPVPTSNRPILVATSGADVPDDDDDYVEDVDELQEVLKNAPAWLISTVFHMMLLIFVALLAAGAQIKLVESEVRTRPAEQISDLFAETLGTQLIDPNALVDTTEPVDPTATEQMITPKDLMPVDDPFAAPPKLNLSEISLAPVGSGPGLASSDINAPMIGLALSGRSVGSRNVLLGRYGGTATTESAVEDGLRWLIKQQKSDGSWSLVGPYSNGALGENDAAATAMALLALQGHGNTHRDGPYAKEVEKAWRALLKMQHREGNFAGSMSEASHLLYTHGQCTIALCELYGMTKDTNLRSNADKAIKYILDSQDPKLGGWRYVPRMDSDTSVSGWILMALQSARMAGLRVPSDALKRFSAYLDSAEIDGGARYGYYRNTASSPAMNAVGLLCRQYLGWKRDDKRLIAGVEGFEPLTYEKQHDVYYWYYAAQAAHHMEGALWDNWNRVMRQEVPAHQLKTGAEAGSWDPSRDKWGNFGGRLYVTCLSICMLEVYYRYLPIYSADRYVPTEEPAEEASEAAKEQK